MCTYRQSGGVDVSVPLGVKKGSLCNEGRQVIKLLTTALLCKENGSVTEPPIAWACSHWSSSSGRNAFLAEVQDMPPGNLEPNLFFFFF